MENTAPKDIVVINASNLIVGRVASIVAKRLLNGEKIMIINAEKAVFSGKKSSRLREFKDYLKIVGRANPKYGPKHPHKPDTMLKKIIRGMLPMDKDEGRKAFRRLKVYVDRPHETFGREAQTIPEASALKLKHGYVSLGKITKEVGWKGID